MYQIPPVTGCRLSVCADSQAAAAQMTIPDGILPYFMAVSYCHLSGIGRRDSLRPIPAGSHNAGLSARQSGTSLPLVSCLSSSFCFFLSVPASVFSRFLGVSLLFLFCLVLLETKRAELYTYIRVSLGCDYVLV